MLIDNFLWKASKTTKKPHWCVEHQRWEADSHDEKSMEKGWYEGTKKSPKMTPGFTPEEKKQLKRDDAKIWEPTYPQDPDIPKEVIDSAAYTRPKSKGKPKPSIEESLLKLMKADDEFLEKPLPSEFGSRKPSRFKHAPDSVHPSMSNIAPYGGTLHSRLGFPSAEQEAALREKAETAHPIAAKGFREQADKVAQERATERDVKAMPELTDETPRPDFKTPSGPSSWPVRSRQDDYRQNWENSVENSLLKLMKAEGAPNWNVPKGYDPITERPHDEHDAYRKIPQKRVADLMRMEEKKTLGGGPYPEYEVEDIKNSLLKLMKVMDRPEEEDSPGKHWPRHISPSEESKSDLLGIGELGGGSGTPGIEGFPPELMTERIKEMREAKKEDSELPPHIQNALEKLMDKPKASLLVAYEAPKPEAEAGGSQLVVRGPRGGKKGAMPKETVSEKIKETKPLKIKISPEILNSLEKIGNDDPRKWENVLEGLHPGTTAGEMYSGLAAGAGGEHFGQDSSFKIPSKENEYPAFASEEDLERGSKIIIPERSRNIQNSLLTLMKYGNTRPIKNIDKANGAMSAEQHEAQRTPSGVDPSQMSAYTAYSQALGMADKIPGAVGSALGAGGKAGAAGAALGAKAGLGGLKAGARLARGQNPFKPMEKPGATQLPEPGEQQAPQHQPLPSVFSNKPKEPQAPKGQISSPFGDA